MKKPVNGESVSIAANEKRAHRQSVRGHERGSPLLRSEASGLRRWPSVDADIGFWHCTFRHLSNDAL
jgi:hypothetical protein